MRLDVGEPDPRNVAALPAAVIEQRVFELPVQVGDQYRRLRVHTEGQPSHERFRTVVVVTIDRRPGVPGAPAGIGNYDEARGGRCSRT